LAGRDQSLLETTGRFGPWLFSALYVMLATGTLMVIGEPARELLAFSFWLKMSFVVIATVVAGIFESSVRNSEAYWESSIIKNRSTKSLALLTLLIWIAIVILGRLIAYDHVWGAWSHAPRA
jgi:hypothetical protein